MLVTQITIGRFHHFHLARQLEKRGLLREIWTGYPRFKLKDEKGIPAAKIRSFPWIHTVFMGKGMLGFPSTTRLDQQLSWLDHTMLDRVVSRCMVKPTTLIALSGNGLRAGAATKRAGGSYFCDRGSTHIRFQDRILRDEYRRWGLSFPGVDPRMIRREEAEYEIADYVSVPSTFVANSFVSMGFPQKKLFLNPYGARLERFSRIGEPERDLFTVLFVGGVSIRKGFLYLLQAFNLLARRKKKLLVVGSVSAEIKSLLGRYPLDQVEFLGMVPNNKLVHCYSTAHVMVLPSVEEGLAMVIGEALACGCPVIASENTGARDLFSDGVEGFILPPRSVEGIFSSLSALADDEPRRAQMSEAAIVRVNKIGGWDDYGLRWATQLQEQGS